MCLSNTHPRASHALGRVVPRLEASEAVATTHHQRIFALHRIIVDSLSTQAGAIFKAGARRRHTFSDCGRFTNLAVGRLTLRDPIHR